MSLSPGSRLGVYEILEPLGAGGMGEVYRARDTRLGREVAVKVLPPALASTPETRARFEREARLISSLNHPHICTVYDVGCDGDVLYLVMEVVEGESLADRVARGALLPADLLRIGAQIADALDRAHQAGIVHRDLKPGNVMLSKSGAKLLDFGLAHSRGPAVEGASESQSPTVSRPITAEGTVIGTFQYMAPEQLEGKDADARTDIWALGCVLYEMATGKRAFEGRSQASLISAIMSAEPTPIPQLAPLQPPALERLVGACLAKEPEERVRAAYDVKLQLQWIAEGGSQAGVAAPVAARRKRRERLSWTVAGAMTVIAAALTVVLTLRPKPEPISKPMIFELASPPGVRDIDLPRISPDGRRLAFNAVDSLGSDGIWIRQMNSLSVQRLPGTEGASRPFWSPDSRFLAYFSGGKLYKIDISGGPPIAICSAPRGADGSWGTRGVILFDGPSGDSVQQVPASGGVPTAATTIDRASGQTGTAWPEFLPDGRHFLYVAYGAAGEPGELRIGSLDAKETRPLGRATSRVEYASRHLMQVEDGVLLAQKFDPNSREVAGDPFPVAQDVQVIGPGDTGIARFSASEEGTLVFRSGDGREEGRKRLVWFDRSGNEVGVIGAPGDYRDPAISPDGTRLAVAVFEKDGTSGVWLYDLRRNLGSRFTPSRPGCGLPAWSGDGRQLAYTAGAGDTFAIYTMPIGGGGKERLLYRSNHYVGMGSWSPNGRWIVFTAVGSTATNDIMALSLGEDSVRLVPTRVTPFHEYTPALSPDGALLAYGSTESGGNEVFVQEFPGQREAWRVSTNGGGWPHWRGDGRELYYFGLDNQMMAVDVEPGSPPRFGLPHPLFSIPLGGRGVRRYAVSRDGQRFLLISSSGNATARPTTVVLDWLGRLAQR